MKYTKPDSPFPVSGYYGPKYFCDRKSELQWLQDQVKGNVPAVVIGIRRLGKTGLIKHLFHHLTKESGLCVFVDLLGTKNLSEMVNRIGDGIVETFPERSYEKLWKILKSLRPTITFDPYNGKPKLGFELGNSADSINTLTSLFKLLNGQNKPVILALDEFQEIHRYEDETESIVRSEMQKYTNIRYIFSGSQTHLLGRMFSEANRPFFGSIQKLYLDKLSSEEYIKFIRRKFDQANKSISTEIVEEGVNWTANHTFYTQYIFNQLFLRSASTVKKSDLDRIKSELMQTSRIDFFQLRDTMSPGHWKILIAAAKEGKLKEPTSSRIIKSYDLGTPRAVLKGIDVLLDREYLFRGLSEENQKFYQLTDVFLMRWIQNNDIK